MEDEANPLGPSKHGHVGVSVRDRGLPFSKPAPRETANAGGLRARNTRLHAFHETRPWTGRGGRIRAPVCVCVPLVEPVTCALELFGRPPTWLCAQPCLSAD